MPVVQKKRRAQRELRHVFDLGDKQLVPKLSRFLNSEIVNRIALMEMVEEGSGYDEYSFEAIARRARVHSRTVARLFYGETRHPWLDKLGQILTDGMGYDVHIVLEPNKKAVIKVY